MTPDDAMMAPVRAVAGFMATLDDARLADVFAGDVVIVENFAPYLFRGADAVARWQAGFREHAVPLDGLTVAFGTAQDFSTDGDAAISSCRHAGRAARTASLSRRMAAGPSC